MADNHHAELIQLTLERLCAEMQKVSQSQSRIEEALSRNPALAPCKFPKPHEQLDAAKFLGSQRLPFRSLDASQALRSQGLSFRLPDSSQALRSQELPYLLPLNWPNCLALRDGFDHDQECEHPLPHEGVPKPESDEEKEVQRGWGLDPNSNQILIYHLISAAVMAIEFTSLPVVLAWQLQPTFALKCSAWLSVIFWSADLLLHFFVGYSELGGVQRELTKTIPHYICNGFFVDLIIVLLDWLAAITMTTSETNSSGTKVLRFFKFQRVLRILRIVRAVPKVRTFLDEIESHADFFAHSLLIGLRIAFIILLLMWLYHVMACLFFALADTPSLTLATPGLTSPFLSAASPTVSQACCIST